MADSKLTALSEISVPAAEDLLYIVDDPAGTPISNKVSGTRLGGLVTRGICQGRLTLTTGVPVTTSDVTGATTIYFTPYTGNLITLYDGTRWNLYTFTERSLALGTLTADRPYDVFLYDNAGTLTLEFTAWTSFNTRATALTTQDGIYVKSGATTRRYLGTFYTTSTTTTEDSGGGTTSQVGGKRHLWNYYNRVPRSLAVIDTTNSWTYTTSAWRSANNTTNNKVEYIVGIVEDAVHATLAAAYQVANGAYGNAAIGVDTNNDADFTAFNIAYISATTALNGVMMGVHTGIPAGVGWHAFYWIENGLVSGAGLTFLGDDNGQVQSGLYAMVMG